jgi:hypothetical protein
MIGIILGLAAFFLSLYVIWQMEIKGDGEE